MPCIYLICWHLTCYVITSYLSFTCYYLTPVCTTWQLPCYHLTPDLLLLGKAPCYDMTCHRTNINLLTWLVTCQISSSCHAITWHPAWYTWPVIISFTGILYLLSCITCSDLNLVLVILYYIYSDLNLQYSCTPELLIMSCTCYSRKCDNHRSSINIKGVYNRHNRSHNKNNGSS